MRILHVVGARPNFMKAAPVIRALAAPPAAEQVLVHTGQHYDDRLSKAFFADLGLPDPDVNLGVGSSTHARQTAAVLERLEPVLAERRPDWVVVYGDVNSTVAAALAAAKLRLPVAHVEAGLRSFDRAMPEELNRLVTDQLSDLLFVTEESGLRNLEREGVDPAKVRFVGNTMIDSLVRLLPEARRRHSPGGLALTPPYLLVTLHRPSNVDDPQTLSALLEMFQELATSVPVILPLHPRTRERLAASGGLPRNVAGLHVTDPLGYLDFLALESRAACVLTDSGGVQEETTYLGVPCLTLRPNTERPITLTAGTNRLVPPDRARLLEAVREVLGGRRPSAGPPPPLWDGRAAERIRAVLLPPTA